MQSHLQLCAGMHRCTINVVPGDPVMALSVIAHTVYHNTNKNIVSVGWAVRAVKQQKAGAQKLNPLQMVLTLVGESCFVETFRLGRTYNA